MFDVCADTTTQREADDHRLKCSDVMSNASVLVSRSLGWAGGMCCARRSSFSMWRSVVLPALSRPKNKIFALLDANPNQLIKSQNQLSILSKQRGSEPTMKKENQQLNLSSKESLD
eukprot:GHVN01070681.1.p2 GENE.GHVN01070681.1~~GHVN01070681.1.p2  ORF type:complete len:116 (-),score=18.05 GHVN01070681.1:122-469(-)